MASHTLQRRLSSPARQAPAATTGRPGRFDVRGFLPLLPLALFLLIALVGPSVGVDGNRQDLLNRLQPPVFADGSWIHPLGTDSLGRDLLGRVLDAARLSLAIGVLAGMLSALVGVPAGILSGFLDGVPDRTITALAEICLSIPTIVVGIVLTAVLGQSMPNLIVILVVSGWITYSRVLRLRVRNLMHAEFVLAAHATGASRKRVITQHVLPNVAPTVVVLMFQQVAAVMIWEASLTYLGIGLAVQDISLGSLIREGQEHVLDAWWIALAPGILIALGVVGFNLAADWLNVFLDPAIGRRRAIRT